MIDKMLKINSLKPWIIGVLLILINISGFSQKKYNIEQFTSRQIKNETGSDTVKIMTWNIKFGGGRVNFKLNCFDKIMKIDQNEAYDILDLLASKINEEKPDVLVLQEVDLLSRRSGVTHQINYLLERTHLNFASYTSQWNHKREFFSGEKQVNSGNAVLSVDEQINFSRIELPTENMVGLKRNALVVDINRNGKTFTVIGTHLYVAGVKRKKEKSLTELLELAEQKMGNKQTVIIAGDFNLLPPDCDRYVGFEDAQCKGIKKGATDYRKTNNSMSAFYQTEGLFPAIDLKEANSSEHFSFSAHKDIFWTRKLDYIFSNEPIIKGKTLQSASQSSDVSVDPMQLSDHAPVVGTVILK